MAIKRVLVVGMPAYVDIYVSFPEMSKQKFQQSSIIDSVDSSIDYNFWGAVFLDLRQL